MADFLARHLASYPEFSCLESAFCSQQILQVTGCRIDWRPSCGGCACIERADLFTPLCSGGRQAAKLRGKMIMSRPN